jgi:hypothetical protein
MPIEEEGREALRSEARPSLEGEDSAREGVERSLAKEPDRPLSKEEQEAAERDPGRAERVHAPASARVPKEPAQETIG